MREFTRQLKNERAVDLHKIHSHNNSKIASRTPEQNEKAFWDKKRCYLDKWQKLREQAETDAQINICEDMLNNIYTLERWF